MTGEKILIVAGGTGGHIFPALAFGRWILDQKKARNVLYLSGNRPLEKKIYASQDVSPCALSLSGSPFGASFFRGVGRWAELLRAFFQTGYFLSRERPDVCFLFGGYLSLPPLLWCGLLGIPAVAHEQNALAGKVTRLASRRGVPVASGWDECAGIKDFTRVGIPVRPFKKIPRREAALALGITGLADERDAEKSFVAGVAGGSLSSASLTSLAEKLPRPAGRRCAFVVLAEQPAGSAEGVYFVGSRWDMTPFYSLCDVVICRAGASTLAELAAYGIPALAIPWKGAADGHQEGNARCFSALTGNPWAGEEEGLEKIFLRFLERSQKHNEKKDEKYNAKQPAEKILPDRLSDNACATLWEMGAAAVSRRRMKEKGIFLSK